MNFDPEVSDFNIPELHWGHGCPIALGVTAKIAFGMLVFFWRRDWLKR